MPARVVATVLVVGLVACGARPQAVAPVVAPPPVVTATPADTVTLTAQATTDPVPAGSASPAPPDAAAARTPQALAAALFAAERTIRDLGAATGAVRAAGSNQQLAYRRLAARPRWQEPVLAATPSSLRSAVRRNLAAGQRLRSLVTPQTELPDWRIRRPAPAVELLAAYRRAGSAFDIPWPYLAAIHLVETRMGRIRGTSTAGAKGPMQFLPSTWAAYGRGDINDNGDAIMAAARYLAANGAPQNMSRALWHYNHSDHYVAAITAYARVMIADERAFRGYYHWQVYYATVDGDVLLPEGYASG